MTKKELEAENRKLKEALKEIQVITSNVRSFVAKEDPKVLARGGEYPFTVGWIGSVANRALGEVKKKVFSIEKYIAWCESEECTADIDDISKNKDHWAIACHGLTEEQMNELNCDTFDVWMVEVEENEETT